MCVSWVSPDSVSVSVWGMDSLFPSLLGSWVPGRGWWTPSCVRSRTHYPGHGPSTCPAGGLQEKMSIQQIPTEAATLEVRGGGREGKQRPCLATRSSSGPVLTFLCLKKPMALTQGRGGMQTDQSGSWPLACGGQHVAALSSELIMGSSATGAQARPAVGDAEQSRKPLPRSQCQDHDCALRALSPPLTRASSQHCHVDLPGLGAVLCWREALSVNFVLGQGEPGPLQEGGTGSNSSLLRATQ
jgi:hypothetical protein